MITATIPTVEFGSSGRAVTRVGLGGEGALRDTEHETEAIAVIREALTQGITYYDSAAAYAVCEEYYGKALGNSPTDRAGLFQASRSLQRSKVGALYDLDHTLSAMRIGTLDLWQIHDVRTREDIEAIEEPGGALSAFIDARKKGLVRHIGVTGQYDPTVLTYCVRNWPVDSVLLPVNPLEAIIGGFLDDTIPAARQKGIAVLGMKVLGGAHFVQPQAGVTAERLLGFALSQDVDVIVVGCSTPEHVRTLALAGQDPVPMDSEGVQDLLDVFRPHIDKLAYYRGTI